MTVTAWGPGWEEGLLARLGELGFGSVLSFLDSLPARPYREVAARLGGGFAPIQLIVGQYREAKAAGRVRHAAMDSLCRVLVEQFPSGWATGENPDWKTILALSTWISELTVTGALPELKAFADAVAEAIRRNPPSAGWAPSGPEDPVLVAVFARGWPASPLSGSGTDNLGDHG